MWVRMIWSEPWKIWVLPRISQVVSRLERPRQLLGRVPEPGPDAAGLVPELELEVEIPLAIGPELLVGDQEGLVDRIPVSQLVYVTTAHASSGHSASGTARENPRGGPSPVEGSIVGAGRSRGQGDRRPRAGPTPARWASPRIARRGAGRHPALMGARPAREAPIIRRAPPCGRRGNDPIPRRPGPGPSVRSFRRRGDLGVRRLRLHRPGRLRLAHGALGVDTGAGTAAFLQTGQIGRLGIGTCQYF